MNRIALWIFARLLRDRDREMILGDLVEECRLHDRPVRWYTSQLLRSIPPVMWANIRRRLWLKTLGAALAAYALVAVLVILSDLGMTMARVSSDLYSAISLVVGFAVMILGGYFAARMRPAAPKLLAAIALVMAIGTVLAPGPHAPLWYECALVVIGPGAAIAGGRLQIRRKENL